MSYSFFPLGIWKEAYFFTSCSSPQQFHISRSLSSLENLLNHSQGLIFCLCADESQIYAVSISRTAFLEYPQSDREVWGPQKVNNILIILSFSPTSSYFPRPSSGILLPVTEQHQLHYSASQASFSYLMGVSLLFPHLSQSATQQSVPPSFGHSSPSTITCCIHRPSGSPPLPPYCPEWLAHMACIVEICDSFHHC